MEDIIEYSFIAYNLVGLYIFEIHKSKYKLFYFYNPIQDLALK